MCNFRFIIRNYLASNGSIRPSKPISVGYRTKLGMQSLGYISVRPCTRSCANKHKRGGTYSAGEGQNPLAEYVPPGQNPLADFIRGDIIR